MHQTMTHVNANDAPRPAPGTGGAAHDAGSRPVDLAIYPDRVDRATPEKARSPSQAYRLPENPQRAALARATAASRTTRAIPAAAPSPSKRAQPSPPPAPALPEPPALEQPPAKRSWWRRFGR
jgi:hypothetical protein